MKTPAILALALATAAGAAAGPYAPAAGQPGSTAIAGGDPRIVAWAALVGELRRGPRDISDPNSPSASFGSAASALGPANGYNPTTGLPSTAGGSVVSLGDGGWITLGFANPITDGAGFDFAVFENGFDGFLELAFVEVSSDGVNFIPFVSASLTQSTVQIDQADEQNSTLDPTQIDGLAGKYHAGWGTPFDLALLAGSPLLNVQAVTHVRVRDVVGSIARDPETNAPLYGTFDSAGRLINDPWTTPFESGGFDLDAVGVLNQVPEPGAGALLAAGLLLAARRRPRR